MSLVRLREVSLYEVVAWRPYFNVVTGPYTNIVVFENLRFRSFTRKQEAGGFKKSSLCGLFWKTTVFTCFQVGAGHCGFRVDGS